MTETNKAGIKEAAFAALWAFVIIIVYDFADTALRLYTSRGAEMNMLLTIGAVLAGCVVVYFALTRYAASFTYEAGNKSLRLTRKIGHREKSIEIRYRDIISLSKKRPGNMPKPVYKMRKTVFSDKNIYYMVYKNRSAHETAVFEPSKEFAESVLSRMKEG